MLIGLTVGTTESSWNYNPTVDVLFDINISPYRLQESYKKGVELSGLDVTKICDSYEDRRIPAAFFLKLKELFPTSDLIEYIEEELEAWGDDEFLPEPPEFATIYMMIAQLGNTDLIYKRINDLETIEIGGFGLLVDN